MEEISACRCLDSPDVKFGSFTSRMARVWIVQKAAHCWMFETQPSRSASDIFVKDVLYTGGMYKYDDNPIRGHLGAPYLDKS